MKSGKPYKFITGQDGTIVEDRAYPPVSSLTNDEKKRVLVTGGMCHIQWCIYPFHTSACLSLSLSSASGFVGSHLVDRLMLMGHQVTVLDNFFTGRKSNVDHWIGHPNFELVRHDVTEEFMMEVDQIYHLACPASPPHYQ